MAHRITTKGHFIQHAHAKVHEKNYCGIVGVGFRDLHIPQSIAFNMLQMVLLLKHRKA